MERFHAGLGVAAGGDTNAGVSEMRRGLDAARAVGAALFHTYYLALLAEILVRARRFEEAAAALDEADRLVVANEERFWESELGRLRAEIDLTR